MPNNMPLFEIEVLNQAGGQFRRRGRDSFQDSIVIVTGFLLYTVPAFVLHEVSLPYGFIVFRPDLPLWYGRSGDKVKRRNSTGAPELSFHPGNFIVLDQLVEISLCLL